MALIAKTGVGHHPHSLEDPRPVVDFILKHNPMTPVFSANEGQTFAEHLSLRNGLPNALAKFRESKKANVAFLGGSITEMEGYRPLVCRWLQETFPETVFTFMNAGISSTCSTTGAFRLESDVFSHGIPDLLFVEFAVNDAIDGDFTEAECIRGMEGIVRQALLRNPHIDVIMTFFVHEQMIHEIQAGRVPLSIKAHELVAKHYGIPTANVATALVQCITNKVMTWEEYGGVHPATPGHALCATLLAELMTGAADLQTKPEPLPDSPLDVNSYFGGYFIDPQKAETSKEWTYGTPDWQTEPDAMVRPRFKNQPLLWATEPGAVATLNFTGTAVGAYLLSGPDAGIVDIAVDDKKLDSINLACAHSAQLYYPWTALFATGLPRGAHTLKLRVSHNTSMPGQTGHAIRILQFVANDPSIS